MGVGDLAWTRSDDNTLLHPKLLKLEQLGGADDRFLNEAYGFVARCTTWSGAVLEDGFFPVAIARTAAPARWAVLTDALVKARLLKRSRKNGLDGWQVVMDDQLLHVRSKAQVMKDREAQRVLSRVQKISREVRLRDGDQCRYCGKTVAFTGDRRSARKGTYDHVVPQRLGGEESVENIVVACGACNRRKGDRPLPDCDGMTLREPPDDPYYEPETAEWLGVDGPQARAGDEPDTAATPDTAALEARPDDPSRTPQPQRRDPTVPDTAAPAARPGAPSARGQPPPDLDPPTSGTRPGTGRAGSGHTPPPPTKRGRRAPRGARSNNPSRPRDQQPGRPHS